MNDCQMRGARDARPLNFRQFWGRFIEDPMKRRRRLVNRGEFDRTPHYQHRALGFEDALRVRRLRAPKVTRRKPGVKKDEIYERSGLFGSR
jgi:hypothetical protein